MTDGLWPLAYDLPCERRGQGEHGCMASWLTVQGRKASVPQANERLFPLAPKSRLLECWVLGPSHSWLLPGLPHAPFPSELGGQSSAFSVQRPASSVRCSEFRVESSDGKPIPLLEHGVLLVRNPLHRYSTDRRIHTGHLPTTVPYATVPTNLVYLTWLRPPSPLVAPLTCPSPLLRIIPHNAVHSQRSGSIIQITSRRPLPLALLDS